MANELMGDTGNPPYQQFEICPHSDIDCRYRGMDNHCVYEHCVYDTKDTPKTNFLLFTFCKFCNEPFARDVKEMKIYVCDECLSRIQAVEDMTVAKCRACGNDIGTPTNWPMSGLCQQCIDNLADLAKSEHHDKLTRCYDCKKCPQG